jgi:uncharacterized protein YceH (UPF0502 family)
MAVTQLSAPEQRVLGCLIEKRLTTPDQYPLSLNSLRLAANQSTNRDPVTHYDEPTVREAAQRLCKHGLARLASGHTSRAIKYRHLAEEALGIDGAPLAVLAVLLLRGPQTPGELKLRIERMARVESLAEIEAVLADLGRRGYALRLDRRPGQKEDRFIHLFAAEPDTDAPPPPPAWSPVSASRPAATEGGAAPSVRAVPSQAPGASSAPLAERVAALEAEVASLRAELSDLRER